MLDKGLGAVNIAKKLRLVPLNYKFNISLTFYPCIYPIKERKFVPKIAKKRQLVAPSY